MRRRKTKGLRDQQQQASLHFTSRGYSKEDENARTTIDTNKAPVVLDNNGRELTADAGRLVYNCRRPLQSDAKW